MQKELFTEFDTFTQKGLNAIYPLLDTLIPMKASHKKELPYACKDLSEYLTVDREFLSRPYWTSPRLLSAYFHFFMMWNLIRLCKLFPSLNFGTIPKEATFVDLGSGPLTLPLALWLSRKDLRDKKITFICCDVAPQPLQIGKNLFEELRNTLDPQSQWQIKILRSPNHKVFRQLHEKPFLITMGNVLNEGDEKKKISTHEQISQIFSQASQALQDNGKIFVVEPGTRQGARMIQILRSLVTEQNLDDDFENDFEDENTYSQNFTDDFLLEEAPFKILSPCPQEINCPLANKNSNKQNAWCHFNAKATYIPKNLKLLSQKAGLDKDSISLSYLFLAKSQEAEKILKNDTSFQKARIISDAFVVPRFKGRARYACHEKGLLLILDSAKYATGMLCDVEFPQKIERDIKSKALFAWIKTNKQQTIRDFLETEKQFSPDKQENKINKKKVEKESKKNFPSKRYTEKEYFKPKKK